MSLSDAIKTEGTAGDTWGTPQDVFNEIVSDFFMEKYPFDPCPNHKRLLDGAITHLEEAKYDGLLEPWDDYNVFVNPPFSDIAPWVEKADKKRDPDQKVILLLPVRSDQPWFFNCSQEAELIFIRGRVNYVDINSTKKSRASFPSMLMIFGPDTQEGFGVWWPKCHRDRKKGKKGTP